MPSDEALTAGELAVLERFRPQAAAHGLMRLWITVPIAEAEAIARRLVTAGFLERRRQSRKGFPYLYRITDAGVAALPARAPLTKTSDPAVDHAQFSPPRAR